MRFRLFAVSACCLLLSAGAGLAQPVGVAAAVNQSAEGAPPGEAIRTITLGQKVIHNERIKTDAKGLLQILLADGTTFTVGPNSELTIDSFVYDPDAGTAKIVASVGKGVFRFIGGRTSKTPDGVRLNTPVGTVGIRGAIADLVFDPGNGIPLHIDLVFGDGITLWPSGGATARLYTVGYSIVIDASGKIRIVRTPEWWTGFFQTLISGRGGEGGGAVVKPTGEMVVASGFPQSNSDFPLPLNTVPIPIPRPTETDFPAVGQGNQDFIWEDVQKLCEEAGCGESSL